MSSPLKKVLLFGKTGEGKSTVANMLVSGNLQNPRFRMGDGMAGVTSTCTEASGRGYHVVDTVGLGEETEIERADPTALIYQYLKKTQGGYSHIIYVKRAGRFDELDDAVWKTFLEVFKGAESAFMLVFTACSNPERWYAENQGELDKRYGLNYRTVFVDFPPVNQSITMENMLVEVRNQSLQRLENTINLLFRENLRQYRHPDYCQHNELQLRQKAQAIWGILKDLVKAFRRYAFGLKMWKQIFN